MKRNAFLLLLLSFFTISCRYTGGKRIRGNGVISSENRQAGTFSRVDAGGNVDVYIKQDSVHSIRVEADENLLPYIMVENRNGSLNIHERRGTRLRPTRTIKVYISGPAINGFELSGASDLVSENTITSNETISISLSGAGSVKMTLDAPRVEAGLSGAGTVTLKGQTRDFKVNGSGSSDINCFELLAENTKVDLSGAGDADVFASVKLDVAVSGAADIRYKGNATVSKNISGAASVRKVE
jgi:Putative auto-transporter adhesin, head GIN domain